MKSCRQSNLRRVSSSDIPKCGRQRPDGEPLAPSILLAVLAGLFLCGAPLRSQSLPASLVVGTRVEQRQALTIREVSLDVTISGDLAETTVEMVFFNTSDRRLEGEFSFPLPEGALVNGYALDVHDVMAEGVIVERTRARQVYEAIVARDVDPGLMEWVKGNLFHTRIFPIPELGSRRVRLCFVQQLPAEDGECLFRLPLRFSSAVDEATCRITVWDTDTQPGLQCTGIDLPPFMQQGPRWSTQVERGKLAANGLITVRVPDAATESCVRIEPETVENPLFMVRQQLGGNRPGPGRVAETPSRVALLWDASASRAEVDHAPELAFLDLWLGSLGRPVTVDLIRFRNEPETPVSFQIQAGKTAELLNEIRGTVYDGGTDLQQALTPLKATGDTVALLFSDGADTMGHATLEPPEGVVIHTFGSDRHANRVLMDEVARRAGGRFIDLLTVKPADAVERLLYVPMRCTGVRLEGGEIEAVFPPVGAPVTGAVTVFGKLNDGHATLALDYNDNHATLVLDYVDADGEPHKATIPVTRAEALPGRLLQSALGFHSITALLAFPGGNAEKLIEAGKRFGFVTPRTSFLVLESLRDYVRYGVEPPAALDRICRDYREVMAKRDEALEKVLDPVVSEWIKRCQWWRREPVFPADFVYRIDLRDPVREPPKEPEQVEAERKADAEAQARANAAAGPMETWIFTVEAGILDARRTRARADSIDWGGDDDDAPVRTRSNPSKPAEPPPLPTPTVAFRDWDPDMPYARPLAEAVAAERYNVYLAWRKKYAASPSFYFDCADVFAKHGQAALAARVLSNVSELGIEEAGVRRRLARHLTYLGRTPEAIAVLRELVADDPSPVPLRELALLLAGEKQYQEAFDDMMRVITTPWKLRWSGYRWAWDAHTQLKTLMVTELNGAIAQAEKQGWTRFPVEGVLRDQTEFDLRIVVTAEESPRSFSFEVLEPSGEAAHSSHPRTTIGGWLVDVPEAGVAEYTLPQAQKGAYRIVARPGRRTYRSRYRRAETIDWGDDDDDDDDDDDGTDTHRRPVEPVTVTIQVFTDYGRPQQQVEIYRTRLGALTDAATLASITY